MNTLKLLTIYASKSTNAVTGIDLTFELNNSPKLVYDLWRNLDKPVGLFPLNDDLEQIAMRISLTLVKTTAKILEDTIAETTATARETYKNIIDALHNTDYYNIPYTYVYTD